MGIFDTIKNLESNISTTVSNAIAKVPVLNKAINNPFISALPPVAALKVISTQPTKEAQQSTAKQLGESGAIVLTSAAAALGVSKLVSSVSSNAQAKVTQTVNKVTTPSTQTINAPKSISTAATPTNTSTLLNSAVSSLKTVKNSPLAATVAAVADNSLAQTAIKEAGTITSNPTKKSSSRRKSPRTSSKRKKHHKLGTAKQYKRKGGLSVHYAKNGRPYIRLKSGQIRFVKGKSRRRK